MVGGVYYIGLLLFSSGEEGSSASEKHSFIVSGSKKPGSLSLTWLFSLSLSYRGLLPLGFAGANVVRLQGEEPKKPGRYPLRAEEEAPLWLLSKSRGGVRPSLE